MKLLTHIPSWLKSKYVLTVIGFAVWMLFFDDRDVYNTYFKQRSELNTLQDNKVYFEKQITATSKELDQLKINAATIEKYAREKYLMKRDNEDLFVVVSKKQPN